MATDGDEDVAEMMVGPNLLHVILELMVIVQGSGLVGSEKKQMVLGRIRENLDAGVFERYEPVFSMMIDILKLVASDPTLLNGLKSVRACTHVCVYGISSLVKWNLHWFQTRQG